MCYIYKLLSSGWHQNYWIINCRYLSTHLAVHSLPVWQMVLFVLLTRSFKAECDFRHPFNDCILCRCILWKYSFLLKLWEREEVWALHVYTVISLLFFSRMSNVQIQVILLAPTRLSTCQVSTKKAKLHLSRDTDWLSVSWQILNKTLAALFTTIIVSRFFSDCSQFSIFTPHYLIKVSANDRFLLNVQFGYTLRDLGHSNYQFQPFRLRSWQFVDASSLVLKKRIY
jgi:hypothetical protein